MREGLPVADLAPKPCAWDVRLTKPAIVRLPACAGPHALPGGGGRCCGVPAAGGAAVPAHAAGVPAGRIVWRPAGAGGGCRCGEACGGGAPAPGLWCACPARTTAAAAMLTRLLLLLFGCCLQPAPRSWTASSSSTPPPLSTTRSGPCWARCCPRQAPVRIGLRLGAPRCRRSMHACAQACSPCLHPSNPAPYPLPAHTFLFCPGAARAVQGAAARAGAHPWQPAQPAGGRPGGRRRGPRAAAGGAAGGGGNQLIVPAAGASRHPAGG